MLDHKLKLEANAILVEFLNVISKERYVRNYYVSGELAWVTFERKSMFDKVNELRGNAGKEPVTIDKICKAEKNATGHSDYYKKFPLYCAEIVAE